MRVVLIGSFRKFWKQLCEVYEEFQKGGLEVLSPKKSEIINPNVDFVILNSDPENWSSRQIQDKVLMNIDKADFVYLVNPNGYIGPTAYFEIGYCIRVGKPVYSIEKASEELFQQYLAGVFTPTELMQHLKRSNID